MCITCEFHLWTEGNGALDPKTLGSRTKCAIGDLTEPKGEISGLDFEKFATQAIKIFPEVSMNNSTAAA